MAVDVAMAHDTAFRAPAVEVGRRLVSEAVWHDDRCTWFGDDVEDDGAVIHRSLAADLYGGTSGVAWFLAHLFAATGDDDVAATAAGALRQALSRTRGQDRRGAVHGLGRDRPRGRDRRPPDQRPRDRRGGGARGAGHGARSGRGPSGETDLIGGLAGTALALLELSRALEDEALLDAAGTLGEHLLERTRAEASMESAQPRLCGLGHGASGIALALLELGAALDDPRFEEAALSELEYERSWFSREHGNWPDLRELDRAKLEAGAGPGYPVFWCHGAAGIGLVRLRAYERTGDEAWLAEAAAAIDTASATILRVVTLPDGAPTGIDLSLCHGVGSVAELHLAAAETTGDEEHLTHARRLVRLAVRGRGADDDGLRLPDEIPCGVPGGGETAGLMVGLAGIGALLLRLEDPAAVSLPGAGHRLGEVAPRAASEGRDRRVAPDLHDARILLERRDDLLVRDMAPHDVRLLLGGRRRAASPPYSSSSVNPSRSRRRATSSAATGDMPGPEASSTITPPVSAGASGLSPSGTGSSRGRGSHIASFGFCGIPTFEYRPAQTLPCAPLDLPRAPCHGGRSATDGGVPGVPAQTRKSLRQRAAGGGPVGRTDRQAPARLGLLGGFALHRDGTSTHQPPHVQRLLAFLALHRRPLHRSFVSGRLWPDLTQEHAFGCLRSTLWRIGDCGGLLEATRTDLALGHWVEVDATELETCAEAVLRRGGIGDPAGDAPARPLRPPPPGLVRRLGGRRARAAGASSASWHSSSRRTS